MSYDLDIRRIVNTISCDKCVFIVYEKEPQANIKTLSKYGAVYPIGLKGLIKIIKNKKKDFIPCPLSRISFTNFEIKNFCAPISKPDDKSVLSYYLTGKRTDGLYFLDSSNEYKAIVKRYCVDNILSDIQNGTKLIFIHSDIGNGKSEAIEQICRELPDSYQKLLLTDNNEKITSEIESICKDSKKSIIIIENFFDYYDVFKLFEIYNNNDNIVFILSARTSIYRTRYEAFVIGEAKTYNLNSLRSNEVTKIEDIFSNYGYYPKDNNIDLNTFITKRCNRRLQSIALSLFDNTVVSNQILLRCQNVLSAHYKYSKLLLFMIIIKLMALNLDFYEAMDLLKITSLDSDFENNESVREIIDLSDNKYSIKSPELCIWLLSKGNYIDTIGIILVETVKNADVGFRINKNYDNFLKNISSFRHLRFVLDILKIENEKKLSFINSFYQSIKELSYYKNKYYFWLQYAISALELKDYSAAELHFRASYSFLPSSMAPYEINNQYARLKMELLLLDSYNYSVDETINQIETIDNLLTPSRSSGDEHYYCYKMSSSYYPQLFNKFYNIMTKNEKIEFKNIAKNKYNECKKYIRFNTNTNFRIYLNEYLQSFQKLALFDDSIEFTVTESKQIKNNNYLLSGYIVFNGKKQPAYLIENNMKNKKGNDIKVTIEYFNKYYSKYKLKKKTI